MKELIAFVMCYAYLDIVQGSDPATSPKSFLEGAVCQTPKGQTGICMNLLKCNDLYTILISQPLSAENRDFLRESQCGFQNGSVLVCCPKQRINTHLLPDKCGVHVDLRYYGSWTKLKYYSWVALVRSNSTDVNNCNGALINERYVVTTARCVNGHNLDVFEKKVLSVRLGEHNINTEKDCNDLNCADPVIDVSIEEIISHNEYIRTNVTQENDIALIRLSQPVNFTNFVRPICLPTGSPLNSTIFRVTGWGPDGKKKQDYINGVPLEECNEKLMVRDRSINLGPTHICVGGVSGFADCLVDSGNSLMSYYEPQTEHPFQFFLAGLFSFGPDKCTSKETPSVYTRVDAHITWILEHLRP